MENITELSDCFFISSDGFHIIFSKRTTLPLRSIAHPDIKFITQVHKANALHVTSSEMISADLEYDALYTSIPNIAIGVYTADCVPLLLFSKEHNIIAAIHAGWKGIVTGVIENTISSIFKKNIADDIKCFIGPYICRTCYEVDEPVIKKFCAHSKYFEHCVEKKHDNYKIDLGCIAENILYNLGIRNIFNTHLCTQCDHRFYSYRRGDSIKRNYNFIWYEE